MNPSFEDHAEPVDLAVEEVELAGHIIDSLILPKVLDVITSLDGSFRIKEVTIGQGRSDPSFALIEVSAATEEVLNHILAQIADHGAVSTTTQDCRVVSADMDGAFPAGFYSTTNQRTQVRIDGEWHDVELQEMDCGVAIDANAETATCVAMSDVQQDMKFIVGHAGVRVFPERRETEADAFQFMSSGVSTEKPKGVVIRQIASELFRNHQQGRKSLIVGGPAIVHTGSGKYLCELIRKGYVDYLFAGNALATHDIEQSIYGTSLGVHVEDGGLAEAGHEHHLRAINTIRRCGGIREAIEQGVLTSGVMFEAVKNDVDVVLAGSIRDDGPLPEVINDTLHAQRIMRDKVRDVSFCLMIATALHSIAVGNLLPAWVKVVCVDINPSTVIKLSDRGSFQTVGLVTDVEPFLRAVVQEIEVLEKDGEGSQQ
jgi:lysine-ketoglutarate reductase/saccharopine dehydrogenase-like protein (TIGR00300 family)